MVGTPKALASTTLAVFRPTPGSAVSASMVPGTSPPWFCMMRRQAETMLAALVLKPQLLTIGYMSSTLAAAMSRTVG